MTLPNHELNRRLAVVSALFDGDQINSAMTVLCTFLANVYLSLPGERSPETQMSFVSAISNGIINAINARNEANSNKETVE